MTQDETNAEIEALRNFYKHCTIETVRLDVAWLLGIIDQLKQDAADNYEQGIKRGKRICGLIDPGPNYPDKPLSIRQAAERIGRSNDEYPG